ncbi:unnamed protein product [Pleuronectes platessa]|uniref:Secreted protein n=1 Tax=Pleuronectes platessa TaxID=8262 RepID=A0A9N7Z4C2_PLEPL|nr:unnamed protein product [Pleuronectes platessa]
MLASAVVWAALHDYLSSATAATAAPSLLLVLSQSSSSPLVLMQTLLIVAREQDRPRMHARTQNQHHSSSLLSFSQPNLLPLYTPSPGHLLPQRSCHCDAPH